MGRGEVVHAGITLFVEGNVSMQLSAKSVGLFEAFYNSVKPISLINTSLEISKPGKFPRFVNIVMDVLVQFWLVTEYLVIHTAC